MADKHTIEFVPTRLNNTPVVFRGMTGREVILMACAGLAVGVLPGVIGAWAIGMFAVIPTVMALTCGAAVMVGGTAMRRLRRGRPETWLYRRIQWALALRGFNKAGLIIDSATYRVRRDHRGLPRGRS